MKKYLTAAAVIIAAACLFSCSGTSSKAEETTAPREKDWHNSIEYEGSFYVNETTKLLYSLDRGTVTLWDDKGSGSVLQTLKYDSTVDDAMERLEFFDANFDGNTDIRIIYDETYGNRYNLWLWNENKGQFDMCKKYKDIIDPEPNSDEGVIISLTSNGIFGILDKRYSFDEHMNLTEVSAVVINESEVAYKIAGLLSLGSITYAENNIAIDKLDCVTFTAKDNTGNITGYLAYNPDGVWYADMGGLGFYRVLTDEGGSIGFAEYAGEAGQVQALAEANFEGDITLVYKEKGSMCGNDAYRNEAYRYEAYLYTVNADGEVCCYIVTTGSGYWYISTDKESYKKLNKNTMKIEDAVTDVFQADSEG